MSHAMHMPASPFENEDDETPFRTTDLLLLQPHHDKGSARQWWLRQLDTPLGFWTCMVAAPVSAILSAIAMLVCLALWFAHSRGPPAPSPVSSQFSIDCFLALGGGAVGPGGSFPRDTPPGCDKQIVSYFGHDGSGKYFDEVKSVADSAIDYFKGIQSTTPASPDQVMVFDIDETVLSNAEEWLGPDKEESQTSSSSSGSRSRMLTGAQVKESAQSKKDRPALEATHKLFQYLYDSGYSIAFITGRSEPSRNGTVANLEGAGYGKQCPPANAGAAPWSTRTEEPCYVVLHLREPNDSRLASIYKPERRKTLQDAGFTLAGNMGDQFSDLEGLYPAVASWKLPNPMYLIL